MTVTRMEDGVLVTRSNAEDAALYPPVPPTQPVVPQSISRRQGRLALLAAGLLDKVEAAIAASDRATQIWYEDAADWRRDDPILARLAAGLGLSGAQVDVLFTQASTL